MDHLDTLLANARERLGCSGLRNLRDLAQMRQETLEKRIAGAQHRLTVRNTLSIYTAWLFEKAFSIGTQRLHLVLDKWCVYLWSIGCTREMARAAWTEAQVMLGPFLEMQPPPAGSVNLHFKIGSAITTQFPTALIAKRKLDVLKEISASPGEVTDDDKIHQVARSPSVKRHKAGHANQGINGPSSYQHMSLLPLHASDGRGDFLSLSPRNRNVSTRPFESAARRAQEESDAADWKRDGLQFNFAHTPPRRSVGGSHWSPRQGAATNRNRRTESLTSAQVHRQSVQFKVEERSPTPPPRVVSAGHAPAQSAPQLQTQMQTQSQKQTQKQTQKEKQKQSWQINNVQSQLIKHAQTTATKSKALVVSKAPEGSTKEALEAKHGQSSIARFGAMISEAKKREEHSSGYWAAQESGRLSPWEEDETVFEIPEQALAQTRRNKAPVPLRPIAIGQLAGGAMNKPPSHFGTPEGVFKPTDNEIQPPPHEPYVPSALTVPVQYNTEHHAHVNVHRHVLDLPQHYLQQYTQQIAPYNALNTNSGIRVAPYPRMHNSPLPQPSILVQRQEADKPVVGYHPSVTRLFRRRPNVWVHQTNRDVALDSWDDFSDSNQPQEYWAWEEYDPFRPLV